MPWATTPEEDIARCLARAVRTLNELPQRPRPFRFTDDHPLVIDLKDRIARLTEARLCKHPKWWYVRGGWYRCAACQYLANQSVFNPRPPRTCNPENLE